MRLSAAHPLALYGVFGSALLAGAVLLAGAAEAKPKRQYQPVVSDEGIVQPPLTVNKRSFLDPGPVVPTGSEQAYMTANTYFATTPDQNFARSKFGNEALPQPLQTPGKSNPVYVFDTPTYSPY